MEPSIAGVLSACAVVSALAGARGSASIPPGLAVAPSDRRRPGEHPAGSIASRISAFRRVPALIGVALAVLLPMPAGLAVGAAFAVVGMRLPPMLFARVKARRRAAADAELPQLLDLLAAASSAGLSAPLALERASGAIRGPLGEDLTEVVRSVALGARWRDELQALAARLDLPDLRRTVAALTRTETLGSSLAASTAELAERVRQARRAAVTERARTAPVKMLFPLVFLVLPAFLLLTVVPVLLTTLQSIR